MSAPFSLMVGLTAEILRDAVDIGIQFPIMFDGNGVFATVGAKYDMIV
jgi:hypothetical protein